MAGRRPGTPEPELVQFAAAASHDLSTPLRLIAGYADLLADRVDERDPEVAAAMDGIRTGVKRMQALVDGLLGYARLGDDVAAERVDAAEVVAEALETLREEAAETGATVEVGELPVVLGLRSQLYQLFQNLLSNAIKFRSEEPPRIVISAGRDPGLWHFVVVDNGIGIGIRDQVRIFDLFKRTRTVVDRPGTGIGLGVAKAVVERHGGHIWVESEPGAGSEFHFTLPIEMRRGDDPPLAGDEADAGAG